MNPDNCSTYFPPAPVSGNFPAMPYAGTRASGGVEDFSCPPDVNVTVFDAAEYLLQKLGEMTTMKLHKLLYYAQAWSLVWDEEILFSDRIEAWANGPVIPVLYATHKGRYRIDKTRRGHPEKLSAIQRETLDVIIKDYGSLHSQYLGDLTHMERPWRDARKGIPAGERGNVVIFPESLFEYYGSLPRGN